MKINFNFFVFLFSITAVFFVIFLLFLSDNNLAKRRELNKQISALESKINRTKNFIDAGYSVSEMKKNQFLMEKYAREQLNMHKANEDVYIIVYK